MGNVDVGITAVDEHEGVGVRDVAKEAQLQVDRRFRDPFVDGRSSLGARFRSRRWEATRQSFPDIDQMRVVCA